MEEIERRNTDRLTGLFDMHGFMTHAESVLQEAEETMNVIYFDVDNFKLYNNNYGRHGGDVLLRHITATLKEVFADQLIARFGEDHFVVLTDHKDVEEAVKKVHDTIQNWDPEINLEIKAGRALIEQTDTDRILDICDCAKMACDEIKHTYDRYYNEYNEVLSETLTNRKFVIDHLKSAIEEGHIKAYFQPIFRILSGKLSNMEALARWEDPDYGVLAPSEFIETLEDAHLIHLLDIEVARQAAESVRYQIDQGLEPVPVSVNLSRLDFHLCEIVKEIETIVADTGIERQYMDIEITERALSDDDGTLKNAVEEFRSLGYKVWMDDFGSVYSSLNALKDYNFDVLKIDMAFLRTDSQNLDKSRIIIHSIIDMAKHLGVQTLCEGVEAIEDLNFLRSVGCEKAQGYYFHEPAPLKVILDRKAEDEFGIEDAADRTYMDEVGRINLLSQEAVTGNKTGGTPLAVFETKDKKVKCLLANEPFEEFVRELGMYSLESVTDLLGSRNVKMFEQLERSVQKSFREKRAISLDLVVSGNYLNFQVYGVAVNERTGQYTTLIRAANLSKLTNFGDTEFRERVLRSFYTIFERIDLFDFNKDRLSTIYENKTRYVGKFDDVPMSEAVKAYALLNVHPDDRDLFLEAYDPQNIRDRIRAGGQRYACFYARTKNTFDTWTWQIYLQILILIDGVEMVMSAVMDADPFAVQMAEKLIAENERVFDGSVEVNPDVLQKVEEQGKSAYIDQEKLLDNVMDVANFGIFWKDKNRRFLGANKFFKDYYGFASDRDFIGKTDEDLGWHVDPEPFKNDEYRVIAYGEEVKGAEGTCIFHGMIRNIVAYKKPVYRGMEIVGLVGYFLDVTETKTNVKKKGYNAIDELTGLLDAEGSAECYLDCEKSFHQNHMDFAILEIDLDGYREIRQRYGEKKADQILVKVAECMERTGGINSSIARVSESRFMLMRQFTNLTNISTLRSRIASSISRIQDDSIDDISVTISTSIYSEMKKNARRKLRGDRELTDK